MALPSQVYRITFEVIEEGDVFEAKKVTKDILAKTMMEAIYRAVNWLIFSDELDFLASRIVKIETIDKDQIPFYKGAMILGYELAGFDLNRFHKIIEDLQKKTKERKEVSQ